MYYVLISGESGNRFWPLSSQARPIQLIQMWKDEKTGEPCSLLQRIWKQMQKAGISQDAVICAGLQQSEIIQSQLGPVNIVELPESGNLYPAAVLSCAYLKSRLHVAQDEPVCILPADFLTEDSFFEALKLLPDALKSDGAQTAAIGVGHKASFRKYGFLLQEQNRKGPFHASVFYQNADSKEENSFPGSQILWDCEVFCVRVGDILAKLSSQNLPSDYEALMGQYGKILNFGLSQGILVGQRHAAVVPYEGSWNRLDSWEALDGTVGETLQNESWQDACRNVSIINQAGVPVAAAGIENARIVAGCGGVLVTGKSANLKYLLEQIPSRPGFEEKSWGSSCVLDDFKTDHTCTITRKVHVLKGCRISSQCEKDFTQQWTVLDGSAELTIGWELKYLLFGESVQIPQNVRYSLRADEDFWVLQVLTGSIGMAEEKQDTEPTPAERTVG